MDLLTLPLAAVACLAAGQDPQSVEAIVADLRQAHYPDQAPAVIRDFEGRLEVNPVDAKNDIPVELQVRFRTPSTIRYQVGGGLRLERGRDELGMWHRREGGAASGLGRAEHATDRATVKRHIELARQLVTFLDPAQIVSQIAEPLTGAENLKLGRMPAIACRTIWGQIDDFPLYVTQLPAGAQPAGVFLKLFIDRATNRLIKVRAMPTDERGRLLGPGESVLLRGHAMQSGVLLPTQLHFFQEQLVRLEAERPAGRQPDGNEADGQDPAGNPPGAKPRGGSPRLAVRARLLSLQLNPGLPDTKFSRSKPW